MIVHHTVFVSHGSSSPGPSYRPHSQCWELLYWAFQLEVCTIRPRVLENLVHFIYTWTSPLKYKILYGLGYILEEAFTSFLISVDKYVHSCDITIKTVLWPPLDDVDARHSLSFTTYIMG